MSQGISLPISHHLVLRARRLAPIHGSMVGVFGHSKGMGSHSAPLTPLLSTRLGARSAPLGFPHHSGQRVLHLGHFHQPLAQSLLVGACS